MHEYSELTIDDPLWIDFKFLKHPQGMVDGFKVTQKLMNALAFEPVIKPDMFSAQVKTDDDIRELLRQRVDMIYYPVGSCKMGIDEMAVVDPQLTVYGINGLRVIDASIMPAVVNVNTNAPTMMIAEKAVDMLRPEHALS